MCGFYGYKIECGHGTSRATGCRRANDPIHLSQLLRESKPILLELAIFGFLGYDFNELQLDIFSAEFLQNVLKKMCSYLILI